MTIATLPAFINAFINGGCDICQFAIGVVGLCFLKTSAILFAILCLQCFDAVGWTAGRASGL